MYKFKTVLEIISREDGLTLIETIIAITIMMFSILGSYGVMLAIQEQQSEQAITVRMYDEARIAMEYIYREISETSNDTVMIEGNSISFASARDSDGVFQWEVYGSLDFSRPVWQKAIVYYVESGELRRTSVIKTDWTNRYDPGWAMDEESRIIAENVSDITFNPTTLTGQDHIIQITLEMALSRDEIEEGPLPTIELSTTVPMMNRDR